MNASTGRDSKLRVSAITALCILSFWKLLLVRDVIWDDNAWLLSIYATSGLSEFLDTGWNQFRRPVLGTLMYYLLGLHRTSDAFYLVWHGLTLSAEIASPILLFYLMRQLFPRQQTLAFFTASAFILFHLDHSLPYASAVHYRIGQVFALGSLYLTALSFRPPTGIRWRYYLAALAFGVIAHSVLIEPAIALEPGRILIIGWLVYSTGNRGANLKRLLMYGAPFLITIVPLAVYKALHKPYGIYAGTYPTDPFFFTNISKNLSELWQLLIRDWFTLLKVARHTDLAGVSAWFLTLILLYFVLKRMSAAPSHGLGNAPVDPDIDANGPALRLPHAFLLGLFFLVPPIWLFEYAGLDTVLFGSQDNAHAIFMQTGYALLLGTTLAWLYQRYLQVPNPLRVLLLVLPLSLGALTNNVSLDLFRESWRHQAGFWNAFVERFPVLPERADFLFDIRGQGGFSDLRNHYDHEVWLNLLYSQGQNPADFKRYRVITLEDFGNHVKRDIAWRSGERNIERVTQLGPESISPRRLISVLYVNNQLFIGREITDRFGKQPPYWPWLQARGGETQLPLKTPETTSYPWRNRLQASGK